MVARLPLPDPCSVELVGTLVLERAAGPNAAYFAGLEQEWRDRVEIYLAERGNPETVPNWPEVLPHRTKFLTLYESPQQHHTQYAILEALRDRRLQMCPSCGEEGTPNTLDHYLPKRQFPHFSVTPANLTPMCDICQGVKGVQTLDANVRRIYLHPYFDDFLGAQVLRLIIGKPYSAPEDFILEPDFGLPKDMIDLVQRHIDGLELQRRYGAFFLDQHMRLLRLAHMCRSKGVDIRDDIPKFKQLHEMHHANVWPHLFYAAVSEDEELLDYLAEGDLPPLR
jgi:5-methylcytosine-specific restriction endonuclease McrA